MHQVAIDRATLDRTRLHRDDRLDGRGDRGGARRRRRAEGGASRSGKPHRLLPDKTLFMLFLDKSTRTRNAFETGMTQLGGHAIFLDADKTQVAHGESPKDMGIILSRYGHGLAIRHDLAPVRGQRVDARDRALGRHPADQPPVRRRPPDADARRPDDAPREARREPARAEGRDVVGLRALVRAAALGAAGPRDAAAALRDGRRHRPPARVRADARGDGAGARRAAAEAGATITFADDMEEAFEGADVVYPKSWGRLDAFTDESTALAESGAYSDWICDARRMKLALASPTRSTCTACRPTAAGRSPTR